MAKFASELPEDFLVRIPDYDHDQIIGVQVEQNLMDMGDGPYTEAVRGSYRAQVETTQPLPIGTSIHWDVFGQDEWVVEWVLAQDPRRTLHELKPMTVRKRKEETMPGRHAREYGDQEPVMDEHDPRFPTLPDEDPLLPRRHGVVGDAKASGEDPGFFPPRRTYIPPPEEVTHTIDEPDELFTKYRVFREPVDAMSHPVEVEANWVRETDEHFRIMDELEEVEEFTFVLKPGTDHHARVALAAYAASVRPFKPRLADDMMDVLELSEWEDENGG